MTYNVFGGTLNLTQSINLDLRLSADTQFIYGLQDKTKHLSALQKKLVSFEGDSYSRPYLSHLDFCVILLQSV